MADPHILYVVAAVVAMALVAFVIVVNVRAPALPYARKNPGTSLVPPANAPAPVAPPPAAAEEPPEPKSKLGEHLEIQDEAPAQNGESKKTES